MPKTTVSRKRNRPTIVCVECRRRKLACDRQQPCRQCTRSGLACVYPSSSTQQYIPGARPTEVSASDIVPGYPLAGSDSQSGPSTSSQPAQAHLHNDTLIESQQGEIPIVSRSAASTDSVIPHAAGAVDAGFVVEPRDSLVAGFEVGGFNGQAQTLWKHRFVKSKLYGPTHWRSSAIRVGQFEEIAHLESSLLFDNPSGFFQLLTDCRQIARRLKAINTKRPLAPDLRAYLPPRETCESLVEAYLRTFETVFRVVHVPTFQKELSNFWNASHTHSDTFVAKLLLILAIGACFNQESTTSPETSLHATAAQWIRAVQAWLETPMHKDRISLEGVQVHCLLALAFQTNSIGGDLTWVFTGTVLRVAMSIGLHRDPTYLPVASVLECEVRRRLWATVLEITLQSSLDSGMPPLIFSASYDCRPPANVNDSDIDDTTSPSFQAKPAEIFTQMSTQCALAKSLPVRLRILHLLNGLSPEPSYEEVLRLGAELTTICRANSKLFQSFVKPPGAAPSVHLLAFQVKLLDLLNRRFLLPLHSPFADKAISNPTYYFSRRVCLESSLLLLSYSVPSPLPDQRREDDYTRLRILGRGLFKHTYLLASANLYVELYAELREDTAPSTSIIPRNEFYQAVQRVVEISLRRIREGETNVKAHLICACAMSQIDAFISGSPMQLNMAQAAGKALLTCRDILKDRLDKVEGSVQNGGSSDNPSGRNNLLDPMLLADEFPLLDPNLDFDFLNDWLLPMP